MPAAWLQALLDGDRSGGEAQIQALTGITHLAGAGFAGVALDGAKLVVLGEADRGEGLDCCLKQLLLLLLLKRRCCCCCLKLLLLLLLLLGV